MLLHWFHSHHIGTLSGQFDPYCDGNGYHHRNRDIKPNAGDLYEHGEQYAYIDLYAYKHRYIYAHVHAFPTCHAYCFLDLNSVIDSISHAIMDSEQHAHAVQYGCC